MKTAVKWVAFGAGVSCASLVGRAIVSNAAGVAAAILSDFEAKRTEVPSLTVVGAHRTTRTPSPKLPTRLQADIELVRSSSKQTISLVEEPAPLAR